MDWSAFETWGITSMTRQCQFPEDLNLQQMISYMYSYMNTNIIKMVWLFFWQGELVCGLEDVTLDPVTTSSMADGIREKLLVDDDSDQAILGTCDVH